jgi:hypothetical protein
MFTHAIHFVLYLVAVQTIFFIVAIAPLAAVRISAIMETLNATETTRKHASMAVVGARNGRILRLAQMGARTGRARGRATCRAVAIRAMRANANMTALTVRLTIA